MALFGVAKPKDLIFKNIIPCPWLEFGVYSGSLLFFFVINLLHASTDIPFFVVLNYMGELGCNFVVYRNDELTVDELKK